MVSWSEEELRLRGYVQQPDGSYERTYIQIPRQMPQSKPSVQPEQKRHDETQKRDEKDSKRRDQFSIVVTSFRKRHMDPDNLCPKWYIDELVRAKIIPDDSSRYIKEIKKQVVKTKGEEYTTIKIIKWPSQ